ncbi:MAG TPA: sugar ABC transporter substrate-binding protein [bacterium]
MVRKMLGWLIFVIVLGCGREQQTDDRPTIALVLKTLNNPFFVDLQNGAQEAADSLGVNLVVQAPEREVDVEKQMQIVENLIQRRVHAICVSPSGSKEIVPAIVKANEAGIPVLAVDTRVDENVLHGAGGRTVTFVGSDNYEGGKVAGKYVVNALGGKGKVAILEGIPGHETGDQRLRGFREVIAAQPQIEVVAAQTGNWERDQGFNVFQNILQSHPAVQALFACNDMMALGAIEAIAAAGKAGQIIVVGFDAVSDAREAIKQDTMAGSVAQYPFEMGRAAVQAAVRVIKGETVPEYIPVKIELITKQNLSLFYTTKE